jgi:hypothetical protein
MINMEDIGKKLYEAGKMLDTFKASTKGDRIMADPRNLCPECEFPLRHDCGCTYCPVCGWSVCK